MTDQNAPTPAEKLKQALAAKKAKASHGFNAQVGVKAEEKTVAARNVAMAQPAFRKASKRG
ncbi:MAG: hypothetical protein P0Y50_04140 [Candidatus Brevundimonas colombiensis]|jgi:hypothetical protein|uniref:Uncharacterized protein n=1 Tax=Candidatus Brevundimonas colombiensis TaxID=3121376 RepID=A0AAJ6BKD8_9CAUL|nr:hypothetical protein [Brevundimonas sp.]WEK40805.1 MAG: hypothetical protein P0Y50_04140 [Brevundimonas sp.]